MVHDVLGTSPGQQIHWYFTELSEVSMCALWMSAIGWLAPWTERENKRMTFLERRDGLVDGLGLVPMLLWTEWIFWGKWSTFVVPLVAVWRWSKVKVLAHLGGVGSSEVFEALWWMCFLDSDPETKPPPSPHTTTTWSLYDRSFFGVFGAATKCAMCYVAWFIIFLQTTKLICSPIVLSCVLRGITQL